MRIVVALGGNALLRRGEPPSAETQRRNLHTATAALAQLALEHTLVVTHGNGPQVGLLAMQSEAVPDIERLPLDILGAQTQGMIGAPELALMKPTAVFVNMARGAIVDEAALCAVLADGRIAGAALDAFFDEPLPADNPLLKLDNVVVSPHTASITHEARRPVTEMVCQDIARILDGKRPRHLANPEVIPVRAEMGRST